MKKSWIDEFVADWVLAGKSPVTAKAYKKSLLQLISTTEDPTLADIRIWLSETTGVEARRKKAQAARAFGAWCEQMDLGEFIFWKQIPLQKADIRPQQTVTQGEYLDSLKKCTTLRDVVLVELLWGTGMRREELARIHVEHLNLVEGFVVVPTSKSGRPRVVPLPPKARTTIRRFLKRRESGLLLEMSGNAIRLRLRRLGLPSAHAWRRGWAVHSLRAGVSEASVRAAAGWNGGSMVVRYTSALAGQLAVDEFVKTWNRQSLNL